MRSANQERQPGSTYVHGMVLGYIPPREPDGRYREFPICTDEHNPDEWQDVPHNTFEHALLLTPGVELVKEQDGVYLITVNLEQDESWLRMGAGVHQIADACWTDKPKRLARPAPGRARIEQLPK